MLTFIALDILALVLLNAISPWWVIALALAGIAACVVILATNNKDMDKGGSSDGCSYLVLFVATFFMSTVALVMGASKVSDADSVEGNTLTRCLDAKSTVIADSISSLSDKETADYYASILENMETEAHWNRTASYPDFCQRVADLNIDVKESVLIEAK